MHLPRSVQAGIEFAKNGLRERQADSRQVSGVADPGPADRLNSRRNCSCRTQGSASIAAVASVSGSVLPADNSFADWIVAEFQRALAEGWLAARPSGRAARSAAEVTRAPRIQAGRKSE